MKMSLRAMILSAPLWLLAMSTTAATLPVHYGLFGDVHVGVPAGEAKRPVVLVSDRHGWDARAEELANALAADGSLVFGIDLPAYLKQMESIKDKASYPAAHFEEMSDWMQRHQGVKNFTYPLLIGDGAGATFAYAVDAQAPKGTFSALVTLGWDSSFRLPKPLRALDAGPMTAVDAGGQYRVIAVKQLPNRWLPLTFARDAHVDGASAALIKHVPESWRQTGRDQGSAGAQLAHAIDWFTAPVVTAPSLPEDVADLPLIEVPLQGPSANRIAIVITGDGGWAGLDIAVGDQLAKRGVFVVGLNSKSFFWETVTPDKTTDAITRIIGHYSKAYPLSDFVIIGYSFGASISPVVINRMPDAARTLVAAQVLISPDPEAVFEVKLLDYIGSAHHDNTIAIAPEIARSKVPVICVHGSEEGADSFCQVIAGKPNVKLVELPGGHHYNGDYDKLGQRIVAALPAKFTPKP